MHALVNKTTAEFKSQFRHSPAYIFLAPGRINIIGEHIDYNDGFVLPAAIDKHICFAITPVLNSVTVTVHAVDLNDTFTFSLTDTCKPFDKLWVNYLLGVVSEIQKSGKTLHGFQLAFSSNIPMGAGLSSSAALTCGFAFALNTVCNLEFSKKDMALIGQKAEYNFAGVQCGIMDQFASLFGKKNQVIKLDCNTLSYQYFDAMLADNSLVLFDSCVKHTLHTSAYNNRRQEVTTGLHILQKHYAYVQTFRDCNAAMIEQLKTELGPTIYLRCQYVITEIARVQLAIEALTTQDFNRLGALLTQTHQGLSAQYAVSCPELDFLVETAINCKGVYGARMMGGGFGGCTINLIQNNEVETVSNAVQKQYADTFGIQMKIYHLNIAEGVHQYFIP